MLLWALSWVDHRKLPFAAGLVLALLMTMLCAAFSLQVIERLMRRFRMRVKAGVAGTPSETG